MTLKRVAHVFDQIEQESSRLAMTALLADLLKTATPHEAAMISYLSLGSIVPHYRGGQFNFADKSVMKALAGFLSLSVDDVKKQLKETGDLGIIAATASWPEADEKLTILELVAHLAQFLQTTGAGSVDHKEKQLQDLFGMVDALSAKYIIRVILGKLRLGFSDMTLLDAFSVMYAGDKSLRQQLEDGYNVSADIGMIIATLKEYGSEGIKQIGIIPGVPIRPAAAERLSDAQAIIDKLGDCIAQPKIDGFRVQVHVDKRGQEPLVRFFSRNLQDMSDMFPDLYDVMLKLDVETLVAEGEAIAYDLETGSFLPFQETVKRKRKHDIAEVAQAYPLRLFLFDILYLNGKSLLESTHEHRRTTLLTLFPDQIIDAPVQAIEERVVTDAAMLENYFHEEIALGLEGLVVKRPDAVYKPGKRNFNWIKLKRQETGSLDDTIDCVILGYYHGHGKRAQFGIGALLVGVLNVQKQIFQTVAKIGTGLTDEEWREQKKECDRLAVDTCPINVECARELKPDVWVSPELVCIIRADEITSSPVHTAGKTEHKLGLALRFPRLMGYRTDKSAGDATTVDELRSMCKHQKQEEL